MANMLSLAKGKDISFLMKFIFLKNMPEHVRTGCAGLEETLRELAHKADKIWYQAGPVGQVHAGQQQPKQGKLCANHRRYGNKTKKCLLEDCSKRKGWLAWKAKQVNAIDDLQGVQKTWSRPPPGGGLREAPRHHFREASGTPRKRTLAHPQQRWYTVRLSQFRVTCGDPYPKSSATRKFYTERGQMPDVSSLHQNSQPAVGNSSRTSRQLCPLLNTCSCAPTE